MEKIADLQPLERTHEYKAVIQCRKLVTDQSSTPLEASAWNQVKKRESFKHKLKDLQKENVHLQGADPGSAGNSQQVSGHRGRACQKSALKF